MFHFFWIIVVTTAAVAQPSATKCPDWCPAEPPCKCTAVTEFSHGVQLISCPQAEFPVLNDRATLTQSFRDCWIRLVNSSFTEIPTDAFAGVDRAQIDVDGSNSKLAKIAAFAFRSTAYTINITFTKNLARIEPNAFSGIGGEIPRNWVSLYLQDISQSSALFAPATFGAQNVNYFTLRGYTGRLEKQFFQNFDNLIDLSSFDGEITQIAPGAFLGLNKLQSLNLNELKLEKIQKNTFDGLTSSLIYLNLWGPQTQLTPWKTDVDDDAFADLIGLITISVEFMCLTTIPTSLLIARSNLTRLSLDGNCLTDSSFDSVDHREFPALRTISVAFNNLTTVPRFIRNLKSISNVEVYRNGDSFPPIVCSPQLCWISSWDALFYNESLSESVRFKGDCVLSECFRPPRFYEGHSVPILSYVQNDTDCIAYAPQRSATEYENAAVKNRDAENFKSTKELTAVKQMCSNSSGFSANTGDMLMLWFCVAFFLYAVL